MIFKLLREELLKPLQIVCGVVERRQTLPILSNVLISVSDETLRLTATDLEVELITETKMSGGQQGEVTVAARKLIDICKALPEGAMIDLAENKGKVQVKAGKSRFSLSTLPVEDFPKIQEFNGAIAFSMAAADLKSLIDKTHFSMAQQDVRYYLNGLLMEVAPNRVRAVATDGHRLSVCDVDVPTNSGKVHQAVIPRKGVLELQRLLSGIEGTVEVAFSDNHVRISMDGTTYTSKLVEGKFPDYERVIPQVTNRKLVGNRDAIKSALHRTSILSNEKYRGIRLRLSNDGLVASANNPELEEAEETVDVDYNGDDLEIGFNVNYVIDALAAISTTDVEILFGDSNSSCLIQPKANKDCRHVIMPMRL